MEPHADAPPVAGRKCKFCGGLQLEVEGWACTANNGKCHVYEEIEAPPVAVARDPHRLRMFPVIRERGAKPHPTMIPWSVADKAYAGYSAEYGKMQSLERLAERGGFYPSELDRFHPTWREESDEIAELRAELARLRGEATVRVENRQ